MDFIEINIKIYVYSFRRMQDYLENKFDNPLVVHYCFLFSNTYAYFNV